jgi:hypothetical protein
VGSTRTEFVRPSFSEEKEPGRRAAKRLSVLRAVAMTAPKPPGAKVFWLLFFKKVTASFRSNLKQSCSGK